VTVEFELSPDHIEYLEREVAAGNALDVSEAIRQMIADANRWRNPVEALKAIDEAEADQSLDDDGYHPVVKELARQLLAHATEELQTSFERLEKAMPLLRLRLRPHVGISMSGRKPTPSAGACEHWRARAPRRH
jgi:Arc/MetJ-type ribon-helix-helix transcriptional regulator